MCKWAKVKYSKVNLRIFYLRVYNHHSEQWKLIQINYQQEALSCLSQSLKLF